MRRSLLLIPLLSIACKDVSPVKTRHDASESYEQVPPSPVDILWIVDDSISMSEEQLKVQEGSAQFVEKLEAAAVDFHLAMTTTDIPGEGGAFVGEPPYLTSDDTDYAALFKDRVDDVGLVGDDEESGLEAAVLALTGNEDTNGGFLRDDAKLAIIVLSDEDDCSEFGEGFVGDHNGATCVDDLTRPLLTPVADIVAMFTALKSEPLMVQVSGIIEPDLDTCDTATPGTRYVEAAELTNGISANICAADYEIIMTELGLRAAGTLYQFELAQDAYEDSIEVWIQPESGTAYEVLEDRYDGWTYSDDPPMVTFHGDAVPPRGSSVTISYEY